MISKLNKLTETSLLETQGRVKGNLRKEPSMNYRLVSAVTYFLDWLFWRLPSLVLVREPFGAPLTELSVAAEL